MSIMPRHLPLTALLVICGTACACTAYEEPPLPKTHLAERNRRLKEVKTALKRLETGDIHLTLKMLDHRDHRVRRRAARRFGELKVSNNDEVEKLAEALNDTHRYVRIEVASALAEIGTTAALDALIRALVDDDYKVRLWAFKGLVRAKNRSIPLLIQHLSSESPLRTLSYTDAIDEQHSIRERLVDCLTAIGKPAVPALKKVLPNENLEVRKSVATILGNIGRDAGEAIRELIEIADSEEDIELRKNALAAISAIGDVDPEVTPTLLSLAQGDNKVIAREARRVISELEKKARKKK